MDILGAKGSRFAPNRCNLLLEVDDRSLTEEDLVLNIRRFRPEGFGVECFMADVLEIPMEAPIPGSDLLIWDINATLPPTGQRLWVLGVKEINMVRGEWDMAYLFDTKSTWLIAPTPEQTSGPLRCLDFFAGAYGGWKSSLEVLAKYNIHSQTVGIEIDERASKAYAMTHYANWIGPQVEIPNDWFLNNQENWMWQQDVTNPKILGPLTHWQPHVITISSPCPDWSSAGTAQGLLKPGAKLLFQTVLLSRWIRPMYIALEQVSNFNNHDHKHWILKALHSVGFRLVWQKVCNLGTHAQTNRLRWLGLAQRSSDLVPPVPFVMWPPREETWPSVCMPWTDEDRKPLCLTADIVELASSAAFLKTSVVQLPTPEVIFAKKIFKPTDVFMTFMALYGQQHHVRKEFLKKHGYLGHFVNDHDMPYHCRFLHPAEVAILHGTCNKLYLDGNYQHAWHHLGNMIATPHALLVLGNVVKAMGLCSNDLDEVFQGFHETKLTANNSCFRKTTKGGFLMRKDQMLTKDFVANVRTLEQSMHHDEYQIWSPTHGMFRNIQGFLQTKATTVTKDFVLKPAQPRFHRALSMQTETVYRSDTMPAHLGTTSEANPCQQEHALHPAVYRPDFDPAETRPAASVVPDVMTNVQSSSCSQPLYRQASHGHATPPIGTCTELKQQYRAGHKAEGSEPDPYCHAHALHPAEYRRSQSHAETPVSTASVSRTHEPDMMQINQHMHPQKGLERVDASRLPKSRDANLPTKARPADHVNNISVPETTKPCNPTEHCPQTSLPDAMPLPRLGCGGPSLGTHMTNDRANKVDAYADPLTAENSCALGPSEVDKAQQMHTPQVDANDRDCPTPQLRCHAMPLPRLGCGGPTHDDDQTMTEASKTNIKRESMQDAEPDHLTKRHCSGSSGSTFDQHDRPHGNEPKQRMSLSYHRDLGVTNSFRNSPIPTGLEGYDPMEALPWGLLVCSWSSCDAFGKGLWTGNMLPIPRFARTHDSNSEAIGSLPWGGDRRSHPTHLRSGTYWWWAVIDESRTTGAFAEPTTHQQPSQRAPWPIWHPKWRTNCGLWYHSTHWGFDPWSKCPGSDLCASRFHPDQNDMAHLPLDQPNCCQFQWRSYGSDIPAQFFCPCTDITLLELAWKTGDAQGWWRIDLCTQPRHRCRTSQSIPDRPVNCSRQNPHGLTWGWRRWWCRPSDYTQMGRTTSMEGKDSCKHHTGHTGVHHAILPCTMGISTCLSHDMPRTPGAAGEHHFPATKASRPWWCPDSCHHVTERRRTRNKGPAKSSAAKRFGQYLAWSWIQSCLDHKSSRHSDG